MLKNKFNKNDSKIENLINPKYNNYSTDFLNQTINSSFYDKYNKQIGLLDDVKNKFYEVYADKNTFLSDISFNTNNINNLTLDMDDLLNKFDNIVYDLGTNQNSFFKQLKTDKNTSKNIINKLDILLENVDILRNNIDKHLKFLEKSTQHIINTVKSYGFKADEIVQKVNLSILKKQSEFSQIVTNTKQDMLDLNSKLVKTLESNKIQKFKVFNFDSFFLNFGNILLDHKIISALGLLSIGSLFLLKKYNISLLSSTYSLLKNNFFPLLRQLFVKNSLKKTSELASESLIKPTISNSIDLFSKNLNFNNSLDMFLYSSSFYYTTKIFKFFKK